MASLSNYISFLFFTTLLLPLQITARDSQFFSKVTHFNNNNNKETTTELPNKEGPVTNTNKPEQQPAFIPETENSYGLYGHDSDPLPSTTTPTTTNAAPFTTTYQPYKTQFEDTNKYPNNHKYYNNDAYNTKYYNKDAFGNNQNELSEAKYTEEEGYNSMENQNNNNNNQKYYFNNNAANERFYSNNNNNNYNAANNRYNGERQGMSDTRFMEGGKYFYDLNYEKYNPTLYGDSSSRGVNTNNNWYNNRGGNNNGNNNAYQNYGNYNGYQNQEKFEDEQEDFEPWELGSLAKWRIHFTYYWVWSVVGCSVFYCALDSKTHSQKINIG